MFINDGTDSIKMLAHSAGMLLNISLSLMNRVESGEKGSSCGECARREEKWIWSEPCISGWRGGTCGGGWELRIGILSIGDRYGGKGAEVRDKIKR